MTDFSTLPLSPALQPGLDALGYTTLTPVQAQSLPAILDGRDVIAQAPTGSGKTAAFGLGLLQAIDPSLIRVQALVLCPTRELADQVAESFAKYAKGTRLNWVLLIGGVSMGDQVAALNKGVDVLIATPGRLLDLFDRGKMLLTGVEMMVVDEADRMLDMGFIPDIERIFKLTPPRRQTLFFSATMPPEITRLTQQFLKDPTRIEVARPATTADTITQHITRLPTSDPKAKRTALRALVERGEVQNGIVFCNRKSEVDIVAKSLQVHGFNAAPIHGDLDQSLRMKTLSDFRSGELKLLVASDVAARGLDIPAVSHVFNYDVPHHADDYVHRIGRTGRAGRLGEAFMIVTPADDKSLDKVLKLIKKEPVELPLDGIDFASIKDRPRDDSRSSRGRGRGERSERGGRSRRSVEETPVEVETQVETAPTPASEAEAAPQRTRSRKKAEARTTPAAQKTPQKANQAESRQPASLAGNPFGDDVPAFLRRPVVLAG